MFYLWGCQTLLVMNSNEESQDGVRDKDVIDVNDAEEDTLELAKYIFNIKILSFSMQSVNTVYAR